MLEWTEEGSIDIRGEESSAMQDASICGYDGLDDVFELESGEISQEQSMHAHEIEAEKERNYVKVTQKERTARDDGQDANKYGRTAMRH